MSAQQEASRAPSGSASPHVDVLVIGGGPAGSTIAALLAERGRRVLLVEKDRHPRFHIGESLLPLNLPLFERLGVKEEIERIGMVKYGVEFVSPYHGRAVSREFSQAWDKSLPYSYQVRRSEFDHVLLRNAAAKGAEVIEGSRVTEVGFPAAGGAAVKARDENGAEHCWNADFLVDASGRDTFLAGQLGFKQRNRKHDSAAIFGHFTGARRLPGKAEGHISIFWFDHGWFWFIPLADGSTSIGAVCPPAYFKSRKTDLASFFMSTIALCPAIADRLKDATLASPVTATGNYSYSADRMAGRSYILVGDAYAFIDPVFSTGVYLAMTSGFLGAQAVEACLRAPEKSAQVLKRYERRARRGLRAFTWYIYRIRQPAFRDLFMSTRAPLRVDEAVLSLLAGDVFRRADIGWRLALFKFFYYANSLMYLRTFLRERRMRSRSAGLELAG
ncbi:MAG TPA: NAD(P)/FAD-dependent oxidoreductase [Stellaceae bacterium]|nr:NAD(P)/FAD-dependent oxidoreductase [Stellaceae bacterium]